MDAELERIRNLFETLSQHKRICVGSPMSDTISGWPDFVSSAYGFQNFVSTVYVTWREEWKRDVLFLMQIQNCPAAARFDSLIYTLRTSHQHADNGKARVDSEQWGISACSGHLPTTADDWAKCARILLQDLGDGIRDLCAAAASVSRNPDHRRRWLAKSAESAEAVISIVAADLDLRFGEKQLRYHVRQVERRWAGYHIGPADDPNKLLVSLVEEELVSTVRRLPCSYSEVLEAINAVGSRDAPPALRLAHAVAETSNVRGPDFLSLFLRVWTTVRNVAPSAHENQGNSAGQNPVA